MVRSEWALERAVPWLELPVRFVWLLAMFLYLVVPFIFPDGRFVPRWTRLLGAAAIPAVVPLVDPPGLLVELPHGSQGVFKAGLGLAVLVWSVFGGLAPTRRRTATGTCPARCSASRPNGSRSPLGCCSRSYSWASLSRACSPPPTRGSSGRCWRCSRTLSTGASTGVATTRPRPSRRSAPDCASSSTSTRSRPSCWPWSTRRCSQRRRRCGFDLPLERLRITAMQWRIVLRHDRSDLHDRSQGLVTRPMHGNRSRHAVRKAVLAGHAQP
jgi:hypothetical protein